MAVLKIPAEIIYTDLKCPQTTQETNSTFCWSKRQKFFANVRTLSPATTFPHPFHLRKLHQQCWALPVIIPGSIHLYLCILLFFFFTSFMLFYLLNPPFPLPPENPYIAYWTLWKHSQRNSLFMVLQELLFHDSTIFTLIWQWHLQQTLPRIVYLQWHLKMLSIWGFALWTQTYISDMLSGR